MSLFLLYSLHHNTQCDYSIDVILALYNGIGKHLDSNRIDCYLQTPTQAKARFKDNDLPRYIPGFEKRINGRYYLNGKQINDHIRDALKHLLYFMKYKVK